MADGHSILTNKLWLIFFNITSECTLWYPRDLYKIPQTLSISCAKIKLVSFLQLWKSVDELRLTVHIIPDLFEAPPDVK